MTWISSVMTSLMDAVSGLLLDALGTDMVVMEEIGNHRVVMVQVLLEVELLEVLVVVLTGIPTGPMEEAVEVELVVPQMLPVVKVVQDLHRVQMEAIIISVQVM